MEDKNDKRNWIYWLRWMILLPAAFVIGFIALFFFYWLIYSIFVDGNICSEKSILSVVNIIFPFIMAIITGFIGFLIAPEYKLKTFIVLASSTLIVSIFFQF